MASSPIRIGITGGIATGKTTVTNYIAQTYGFPILDADLYAHQAVALGSPLLHQIQQRYSDRILLPTGELDRPQLGQIIFQDATEKRWLEQLIHPYVRQQFEMAMSSLKDRRCVLLAIPLLFEAQLEELVDQIWVVSCAEHQQLARLMARNGLTQTDAIARINNQMPLANKIALADHVIDNDQSLEVLHHQIDQLIHQLPCSQKN
ncbi:MAG: dephospho-CoA kinase [Synechococcaceae cyanobacterium RL_1_2]|nr:dephospho-CoA kinase [Synechococcaceae cyanobacterium RL_1_2]